MLRALQALFRAHPDGLTIDEILDRYGPPFTPSLVPPRAKRPKHIKGYLQRAIDLGMMRAEPSALGFRYHASDSFFSLVEDRSGQLVYAFNAERGASRDQQAGERREELEAQHWAEHKAEKLRQQEAFRREWEAGAEKRAQEDAARRQEQARKEDAFRLANTARLVDGQPQCPHCSKSLGLDGVSSRICKPEGCGRSVYLPDRLGVCEACGRWQSIPEGQHHGVCQCGAHVFEWQRLLVPDRSTS